jgi:hypothetical protein
VVQPNYAASQVPANAVVKPCSKNDWQFASSPEAKALTKSALENFGSGFSSCETAMITFLPNSRIVRLHTPIHVDWSYTAILLQSEDGGPVKLIASGRGLVARPRLDAPDSITALNFLLAAAKVKPDSTTIKIAGDLYFFILDSEPGLIFGAPPVTRDRLLDAHEPALIEMSNQSATVTYSDSPWKLVFNIEGEKVRLTTAIDRSSNGPSTSTAPQLTTDH